MLGGISIDIGLLIEETFKDFKLPFYYIKRPNSITECIVYTYIENPALIADMEEKATKYTILFNIYCTKEIEKNKKLVKDLLTRNGFKKKIIVGTILEENNSYNTAMQYIISIKN